MLTSTNYNVLISFVFAIVDLNDVSGNIRIFRAENLGMWDFIELKKRRYLDLRVDSLTRYSN
jgi:hypothetical protein